jgi:predicted GIY-YIG superfamily endonuclease
VIGSHRVAAGEDFFASLPTTVYVATAADESVLYVGMTGNLAERMHAHRAASSWWPMMAALSIETHPNRAAAARRETELVEQLKPPHNAVNKPSAWRERDEMVLALCQSGMPQVDIAVELGVSIEAVHRCTARLRRYDRLGLRPKRQLSTGHTSRV